MKRRIVSVLLAGASVAALSGLATGLANSVSTTPPPAFVRSVDRPSDDPATHDAGDDHGGRRRGHGSADS